ncbi:MAG: hypothetical protein D4S01_09050 [Dehalococcoidia bacterium]|nr:MAG: hypothetical protein D4S01_09050 [Dehalococcoidia bacterium]
MNYKLKRVAEIYANHKETVDRINKLTTLLSDEHGHEEMDTDWSEIDTNDMKEFVKLIEEMHEELRDEYLVTEKTSQQYLWDTLRLAFKGKI